jgi:hypothetical protein
MGVGTQPPDFTEFYRTAADECLRAVLVSTGDRDAAQELVDEAHGGTPPLHPSLPGPLLKGIDGPLAVGLVYASQQCTG